MINKKVKHGSDLELSVFLNYSVVFDLKMPQPLRKNKNKNQDQDHFKVTSMIVTNISLMSSSFIETSMALFNDAVQEFKLQYY